MCIPINFSEDIVYNQQQRTVLRHKGVYIPSLGKNAMRLILKNIPLPEAHIFGLILGTLAHVWCTRRIFPPNVAGKLFAGLLILSGTGLILWAVSAVQAADLSSPRDLITRGPYAYSRNPMYVGWSLLYLGISFVVNSIWPLGLFPAVWAYSHFVVIKREEKFLQRKFGVEYEAYQNRVPRYL